MISLGHRTLRSGKEFSLFDLVVGPPVSPPQYFSVADCLKERLDAQEITRIFDEPAEITHPSPLTPPSPPPSPPTSIPPSVPASAPPPKSRDAPAKQPNAMVKKKKGSKHRRKEKRERESAESSDPSLKSIHQERRDAAKKNAIQVDVNSSQLPHTKRGWIGKLRAQDGSEAPPLGSSPIQLPPGLDTHSYTQEEIDLMSGTKDFSYVAWPGDITIPVIDSHRRTVVLLGGKPKDLEGWKIVTDGAAELMARLGPQGHFTYKDFTHRRAHTDTPYPSVSRGLSLGGGQTQPGELYNHPDNIRITDEMLAHEYFRRIVGFTNCLVRVFAPLLFLFYQSQMALLAAWNAALRFPFEKSIFAACTFNFGPRVSTCQHLDFGNLAWGWCAITALGKFDADRGGHLILWDLKLVIRFPAGATIFIPSAIIRHSNTPVQPHETRSSFVQYTAGGLFRWIRNGYMTDEEYERTASGSDKLARATEAETRWQEGVEMFSVLEDP